MACIINFNDNRSPEEKWQEAIQDIKDKLDCLSFENGDMITGQFSTVNPMGEVDGKRYWVSSIWQEIKTNKKE